MTKKCRETDLLRIEIEDKRTLNVTDIGNMKCNHIFFKIFAKMENVGNSLAFVTHMYSLQLSCLDSKIKS